MDQSNVARRPGVKSGAEQDVVTGWRKYYCYTQRSGVTSGIKRRIRRRERRAWKVERD